jgi:hypothetical protein
MVDRLFVQPSKELSAAAATSLDTYRVNLMQYKYHDAVSRAGSSRKLHLASESVTTSQLLPKLEHALADYIKHSLTASWQNDQYLKCIGAVPENEYVVQIDFSENASFDYDREVQSAHFDAGSRQCTLLIAITRHWEAATPDAADAPHTANAGDGPSVASHLVKTVHAAISDDKIHDPFFAEHFLEVVHTKMVGGGMLS